MNVAYFGGAFDPIHKGHIELAVQVAKLFDQVWLVPCYGHVHGKNMMSAEDRWSMMCKAWPVIEANCDNIIISDFEIINEITTGTYDSLVAIKNKYSQHNFSVIIGQDNAETINTWEHHEKLIKEFSFVVFPRGDLEPHITAWYLKEPHRFLNISVPPYSSREIRECIRKRNYSAAHNMLPNKEVTDLAISLYS